MASSAVESLLSPDRPAFTDEQRRAIETRDVSVALSAGAGCGKTFVLTQRFFAHLDPDDPAAADLADLSELIAITFTERAAREMRDRIRSACSERLQTASEDQAPHWLRLLRQLDAARVSTIHSFCGSLLRSHAVEARLDPNFGVLDETQAQTLLAEVVEDRLRELLAGSDETTIALIVRFGMERLTSMATSLLGASEPIDFEAYARETPETTARRWEAFHREKFLPALLQNLAECEPSRMILKLLRSQPPRGPIWQERVDTLLSKLPGLHASRHPDADLAEIDRCARVQHAGGKRAWPDEGAYQRFKTAAERLRKRIQDARCYLVFDAAAALPAAQAGLELLSLAGKLAEAYEARKQELAVLDFDDLLRRAHRLLTDPLQAGLQRRLASQVRLLLVDEFQDTDPLQVELVKALCGEIQSGKLFFVGDYKQSIYRFRGAQPHVFRQLEAETPEAGRLPLNLNFRSQPAILDFVNALFCKRLAGSPPLRPHRSQATAGPCVEFLWAQVESTKKAGEMERARRLEADWIARRLRALIDSQEPLIGEGGAPEEPRLRPVHPGDIAILFRALSDVAYYEQALQKYELPYYLVGGHAFYSQQEIFDVLNLLRTLASPADEISLAAVLRSPFFSLADETLFWLAQHSSSLSAGLHSATPPSNLDDDQRRRVTFARETLAVLRGLKDRLPVAELIGEALARTGYDAVLLAEFLGERKLANLRKLIQQARTLERSGMFSLPDFILQLSHFVVQQPREALAATHPENASVIRLMTIHQAKGLEFPVVVVPDLDRTRRGRSETVAFTGELGPLVKLPVKEAQTGRLCGYDMFARLEDYEEQEELVRLLYVATTRAADRLMLSSSVAKLDEPQGPWLRLLAERFDLRTGACVGPLAAGWPLPEVAATLEEPRVSFDPASRPRRPDLAELAQEAQRLAADGGGRPAPLSLPVAVDTQAQRQYSFSRLNGVLHQRLAAPVPAMVVEEAAPAIDPIGLGTLTHAVLAEIAWLKPADVQTSALRHAARQGIDSPELIAEAVELIARFLKTRKAAELRGARRLHTEIEFLLAWPLDDPRSERLFQGFIDCLYQDEAGAWRLLDYKTNQVAAPQVAEAARPYELQMCVYALAAEQTLKQPPESLTLHFLRPGVDHHFPWNAAARRSAIALISEALALATSLPAPVAQAMGPPAPKGRGRPEKKTQQQLW